MNIKFEKWQALGNDFVILKDIVPTQEEIIKICYRRFGIGCDQLVTFNSKDFKVRFFNSDGSESGMCGNALRCLAKYHGHNAIFHLNDRSVACTLCEDGDVSVEMGMVEINDYPTIIHNDIEKCFQVNIGNPHVVILMKNDAISSLMTNVDHEIYNTIGKDLNASINGGTNVEFVWQLDDNSVFTYVWERGVGRTLACGSGACAVGAVLLKQEIIQNYADVYMQGSYMYGNKKPLRIILNKDNVTMKGSGTKVYEGVY